MLSRIEDEHVRRFEEDGFSLVTDHYVGAQRYQAGAGVLISKDSEAPQHIPIYLFGNAQT